MNKKQIHSNAFREAELRSERLRILGVLGVFAVFVCLTVLRVFVIRTASKAEPAFLLAAVLIIYELWMLHKVDLALKSSGSLSPNFRILSTVVETSIPAFAIAFLTGPQIAASYRSVASPAFPVFFVFIILSTLRLSPLIGILSGIVASASYICAALYSGWRAPVPGTEAHITQSGVSLNAVTLLVAGVVAGAVAGELRRHVQAALREAETNRKLQIVQHDLQVARSIQQSLLPQETPQIEGYEIAGWNCPADDTGGDYFDWNTLSNGKVIVSLADVTGHGIGPALLASVCHAYARSSFNTEQDLSRALERINQDLGADLTSGRFVTFVAAICCPGCPDVEMLSAGHGPIFVYSHPEDRFRKMSAQALPFGILPSFRSDPPEHLHLDSGDLVLLATDGFFEWENDQGEQFGVLRMEESIRSSRDLAPAEIIMRLYEKVNAFSNGTKQQDDLTAVVIKRL
jgi:serine phosphatase RsbU (regulator of sigma subunit)